MVERFAHEVVNRGRIRSEMHPHPDGHWVRVEDLPAIKAHWLEQLKEELLTDGALLTICAEVSGLKGGLPEDVADLRRGLQALLDAIPIEEGGDGGDT